MKHLSLAALLLSWALALPAEAATQINCYSDDRAVPLTLGTQRVSLSVPRNLIAYPRDPERPNQPFVVLAARVEDGAAVCRATLNDIGKGEFQLHLSPGSEAQVKQRLAALLRRDYPVKVADNDKGFTVWRGIFSTVENEKTYYYELMVPNKGAQTMEGYVICAGESITGARLYPQRCTAHEAHAGLFLQYKFLPSGLESLETVRAAALQLADKVLGNPKE
jgi:hypothetical protein